MLAVVDGDLETAARDNASAIDEDPTLGEAHLDLAAIRLRQGDAPAAEALLAKAPAAARESARGETLLRMA